MLELWGNVFDLWSSYSLDQLDYMSLPQGHPLFTRRENLRQQKRHNEDDEKTQPGKISFCMTPSRRQPSGRSERSFGKISGNESNAARMTKRPDRSKWRSVRSLMMMIGSLCQSLVSLNPRPSRDLDRDRNECRFTPSTCAHAKYGYSTSILYRL